MTAEERELIIGLFDRLRAAEPAQKDADAEQLIQKLVAAQPSAPYLFVQTLLVQEHALQNAQAKLAELERQRLASAAPTAPAAAPRSFLSGLLHPTAPSAPAAPRPATASTAPPPLPYASTAAMAPSAAGTFLQSALSTAAGVAGGSLLFQGIESLLGHHAGAFGSGMGGFGSSMGFDPAARENVEVVNNYYGDTSSGGVNASVDSPGADLRADDQSLSDNAAADLDTPPVDDTPDTDSGDFSGGDSGDSGGGGGDSWA